MSELTKAITSGGGSKVYFSNLKFCVSSEKSENMKLLTQVTMEHLEESIRTLKEMFIERKPVIEV